MRNCDICWKQRKTASMAGSSRTGARRCCWEPGTAARPLSAVNCKIYAVQLRGLVVGRAHLDQVAGQGAAVGGE